VDEAHHLLPQHAATPCCALLATMPGLLLITVNPQHLAPEAIQAINVVIAIDGQPSVTLQPFAEIREISIPGQPPDALPLGEGVIWDLARDNGLVHFCVTPCRSRHRRHRRKYAEGDMGWERSFYFTGPNGQHNLRAQNLIAFMDTADHVEDETWLYHANRGDFSHWIRDAIGDGELADYVAEIEASHQHSCAERRTQLRHAIEQRYTLPA
jgi:hypothetical protein